MTDSPLSCWAVIPAAGIGSRMQADRPKQYLPLGGKTVIEHTLDRFVSHPYITGIVIALDPGDEYWPSLSIAYDKPLRTVSGGPERCHSVLNALKFLEEMDPPPNWVAVHDAARPCLTRADLDKLLHSLASDRVGGILAVPVRDTIKYSRDDERITETVDRTGLWHAMTPQMFRLRVLAEALQRSLEEGQLVTDEASAVEHIGLSPRLVRGRADNIKITRPEDLTLAAHYLASSG